MRITFISDTHTKHTQITQDLPGGDLLIHAGDLMNSGYYWEEVYPFLDWYNNLGNYDHKVFIAGNHDRLFEDEAEKIKGLLTGYKNIDYLRDEWIIVGDADPHDPNVTRQIHLPIDISNRQLSPIVVRYKII